MKRVKRSWGKDQKRPKRAHRTSHAANWDAAVDKLPETGAKVDYTVSVPVPMRRNGSNRSR